MGKDGFMTPKAIANRIKVVGPSQTHMFRHLLYLSGERAAKATMVLPDVPKAMSR